jgi:hypothetical protein
MFKLKYKYMIADMYYPETKLYVVPIGDGGEADDVEHLAGDAPCKAATEL